MAAPPIIRYILYVNEDKLSDTSLDARIPSFPGSPRSFTRLHMNGSETSIHSIEYDIRQGNFLQTAVNFIHTDVDLLHLAEIGDSVLIENAIRRGVNVDVKDHLGRTALHFAVQTSSIRSIILLLQAGVQPSEKDKVGMTPLSLCLMRRPSLRVATLLFEHGARLLPRNSPVDTGLFLQFVMMCTPTSEDAEILRLLIEKGALINDPKAPGGRSALHFAAMSNNCNLIQVLVDLGANLFAVNHRGQTPRGVAVTYRCRDAIELLDELIQQLITKATKTDLKALGLDKATSRSVIRFKSIMF